MPGCARKRDGTAGWQTEVMFCVPAPAALAWLMAHRNVPADPSSAVLVTWRWRPAR